MKRLIQAVYEYYSGLGYWEKKSFFVKLKEIIENQDKDGFFLLIERTGNTVTEEENEYLDSFFNLYLENMSEEDVIWVVRGFGVFPKPNTRIKRLYKNIRYKIVGLFGKKRKQTKPSGSSVEIKNPEEFEEIIRYYSHYLKDRTDDVMKRYLEIIDRYGDSEEETTNHLLALYPNFRLLDEFGNQISGFGEAYDDRTSASVYMLVHGYAYTYLYYHMYSDLFKLRTELNFSEDMKILSVGCGTKIDYVGMKLAFAVTCQNIKTSYLGIEPAVWEGTMLYEDDDSRVENKTIEEYLDEHNEIDTNVIILPYSLPTLSSDEFKTEGVTPWQYMVRELPGKLTADRVVVMTSIRGKALLPNIADMTALKELESAFKQKGYVKQNMISRAGRHGVIEDVLNIKDKLGFGADGEITDLLINKIKKDHSSAEREIPIGIASYNSYLTYVIDVFAK